MINSGEELEQYGKLLAAIGTAQQHANALERCADCWGTARSSDLRKMLAPVRSALMQAAERTAELSETDEVHPVMRKINKVRADVASHVDGCGCVKCQYVRMINNPPSVCQTP